MKSRRAMQNGWRQGWRGTEVGRMEAEASESDWEEEEEEEEEEVSHGGEDDGGKGRRRTSGDARVAKDGLDALDAALERDALRAYAEMEASNSSSGSDGEEAAPQSSPRRKDLLRKLGTRSVSMKMHKAARDVLRADEVATLTAKQRQSLLAPRALRADPGETFCEGEGLVMGFVHRTSWFDIMARDAWGGPVDHPDNAFTVLVSAEVLTERKGAPLTTRIVNRASTDGSYRVTFVPSCAGPHRIRVYSRGSGNGSGGVERSDGGDEGGTGADDLILVHDSRVVILPAPVFPGRCAATGRGLNGRLIAGVGVDFTLVLCDRMGNVVAMPFKDGPDDARKDSIPRPDVLVTLIEPRTKVRTPLPTALLPAREYRDGPADASGMHRVAFTPPADWGGKTDSGGPALVEVTVDGKEIAGSPFSVEIFEKMDLDHLMDHKMYVDDEWNRHRPTMLWDPTTSYGWESKLRLPYEHALAELRGAGSRLTPASAVRLTRTLPSVEYGHADEVDSLDEGALRCRHDRVLFRERYALLQYRIGVLPNSYWTGKPGTQPEVPWADYDLRMRKLAKDDGAEAKSYELRMALERRFTFPTLAMQAEVRNRFEEVFGEKLNQLSRDVIKGKRTVNLENVRLPVYAYNPSRGSKPKEYFSRAAIAKAHNYGRWGVNVLTKEIPMSKPGMASFAGFKYTTAQNATQLAESTPRPLDDTRSR